MMKTVLQSILLLLAPALLTAAPVSNIKPDELLVFFPAVGIQNAKGGEWELTISGCVFEFEKRRAALYLLRSGLGWDSSELTVEENAMFEQRAQLFLVDNERGKKIVVEVGGETVRLGKSADNGHFAGTVRLSDKAIRGLTAGMTNGVSTISYKAILPKGDERAFGGDITLIRNSGIAVVSDIDDTIKISEVLDRKALLRNTFLSPFQPVPGMAGLYASWTNVAPVQFFYVSASPWQLYQPLAEFVRSNGFPTGAFLLKDFRWKDRTVLNLFKNPEDYKLDQIERVVRLFPKRDFVLVGDSGERDPEAYATLARRYPRQVKKILIRDVTQEPIGAGRYQHLMKGLPSGLMTVFNDPDELQKGLPIPPGRAP